jgi:hypothetical protein
MADEDIVVEIEAPAPEENAGETGKTQAKTAPDPVAELKAQYDELQAESERQRAAREAAERRAGEAERGRQAAEREVETSRTEVVESRLGAVETGLEAAKTESAAAKADYIAAQEAGDWKRAAEAQERLAAAQARIVRFDEAKSDLEIAKTQKPEQRQQETQRQPQGDPLEIFLSTRTPETQKWLREHPVEARALALGTDSRRAAKINAADSDAVAEGYARDTPEYFAHIEKFLGLKDATNKTNGATNGKTRAKPAPVAPVNTTAGETTGGGSVVRLSKGEAAAATDGTLTWNYDDPSGQKRFKKGDPIGVQEMARRKQAMTAEGRYDPMNFIQQ